MKDNVSPEEKLLRLIRGQKKQDAPEPATVTAITNIKPGFKLVKAYSIENFLNFFNARKVVILCLAASCLYLAYSFIYPSVGLKQISAPQLAKGKITEPEKQVKEEGKPYEYYLEGIKSRQIFSNQAIQQEAPRSAVNAEMIKDLNLIGIISGENPQAIIEDKKNQKTFYLSKGQSISEFKVEDIQEGKVVLSYQGQRYELYL